VKRDGAINKKYADVSNYKKVKTFSPKTQGFLSKDKPLRVKRSLSFLSNEKNDGASFLK